MNQLPEPSNGLARAATSPSAASAALSRPSGTRAITGVQAGFLATSDGGRFYCPKCGGLHGVNPDNRRQGLRRRMAAYVDPQDEAVVVLACWDCHGVERVSRVLIPENTIIDALPGEAMQEWLRDNAPKPRAAEPQSELPAPEGARRLVAGSDREIVDG